MSNKVSESITLEDLENRFKFFSEEYLTDDLKIDGVARDYYINLEQRIIISTEPVTYENVDYYMLEQMENGGYNVQYNNQVGDLNFELKVEQLSNSKGKITIFNITYPGYIEKWEAQYRIKGTENWNSAGEFTGSNYEFEVTQAGTYEVRLIHGGEVESGIQIAEVKIGDIITDGLILYYDAINNTGNGHDANSTVWKDLSGNGNDGKLVNINNTADSGWQEDGLKLDGIDDYVEISPDKLKGLGKGTVIVDFVIYDWNPNEEYNTLFFLGNQLQWNYNHIQISEDLYTASRFNTTVSNNKESTTNKLVMDVDLNQYKQIALTWNGTTVQNFNNGIKESSINSTITPANDSTVCYLGRNYYADTRNLNCKISSVKIYNRDLTEEEIQKTYELDNERYK